MFNPGERVEGYTNFLWVIVLALPRFICSTESLPLAAKWVGLFFSLLTLILSYGIARRTLSSSSAACVPLTIAASPGFLVWTVAGLETPLITFLIVAALLCDHHERSTRFFLSGVCLGLAMLTRPDALIICGAFVIVNACFRTDPIRYLAAVISGGLCVVLPHVLFRYIYYGTFVPNTFWVKTTRFQGGGTAYFLKYLPTSGILTVILAILGGLIPGRHRIQCLTYAVPVCLYIGYIHHIGGDWMPMGRYLVPLMPLLSLSALTFIDVTMKERSSIRHAIVLICILLALISPHINPIQMRRCQYNDILRWESAQYATWKSVGVWFAENAEEGDVLTTGLAGIIPYYSGLRIIDRGGLNDREIATMIYQSSSLDEELHQVEAVILRRGPDFVMPENQSFSLIADTPLKLPVDSGWSSIYRTEFEEKYERKIGSTKLGYFMYFQKRKVDIDAIE